MTDESRPMFYQGNMHPEETMEYLRGLETDYDSVTFKVFIQPWKKLGLVYNQLLSISGDYYINLEDDIVTYSSSRELIEDGISLLTKDSKLLGVGLDLYWRSATLGSYNDEIQIDGKRCLKSYIMPGCGATFLVDTNKIRDMMGQFKIDHDPKQFGEVEMDVMRKMIDTDHYVAVNPLMSGCLRHEGSSLVTGKFRPFIRFIGNEPEEIR
jgi:hypothetical protein